jgi:hypothetical protein
LCSVPFLTSSHPPQGGLILFGKDLRHYLRFYASSLIFKVDVDGKIRGSGGRGLECQSHASPSSTDKQGRPHARGEETRAVPLAMVDWGIAPGKLAHSVCLGATVQPYVNLVSIPFVYTEININVNIGVTKGESTKWR